MLKVACLVSNRCTFTRQKVLFEEIRKDPELSLSLIVTGGLLGEGNADLYKHINSNYGCNSIPLPDYDGTRKGMAETLATLSSNYTKTLLDINPDVALIIADRFELLPFASVAAYLNIPLVHLQAFEVSGNIDNKVRGAVSALADIHLTSHCYATVKGIDSGYRKVYTTGCPSIDYCKRFYPSEKNDAVILMYHPLTTDPTASRDVKLIYEQTKKYCNENNYALWWFAPNNDPGYKEVLENSSEKLFWNLEGDTFYKLLAGARAIVGNSSAGIREASYFGVKAVNVGKRQEGRERAGNVIDCSPEEVYESLNKQMFIFQSHLFGDGDASSKIINILKEKRWLRKRKNQ